MSIITKTTHCVNWLNNIIDYLIDDEIKVGNYWCSGKNDLSPEIAINEDELAVTLDSGMHKIVGKIIAYGKSEYSYPPLTPQNSGRTLTIEDIYYISIQNGFLNFTNDFPKLSTYVDITDDHSSNVLNGLNKSASIGDFLNEINSSLEYKQYQRSSNFSYLIFEPYIISWFGEKDQLRKSKIMEFNKKHEAKRNLTVNINKNGGIIINQN